ncbi:MAG: hypothetical protein LBH25_07890 [Fibromonadaceae bacterium]|nr:hypothetical protein [Fibromonadaceae bacterium]
MTFVFICDSYFQKKVLGCLVNGDIPDHEIITITSNELLQTGKLPDNISGVIVERRTWQKNFSLFRYFGLLPLFEEHKLAFLAGSSEVELKGRSAMKSREFVIPKNISAEEVSAQLTHLLELPPSAFSHPKSRAVA